MALTKISSNLVADDAIVTGKIADGGVATADLAANAVTTAKIAQNNVTAHHIADGSITTTQIAADAVTNAKIADDAISEEHLDKTIISDLTEVTAVNGDFLMIGDTSDSNNLKKVPVSSLPGSSALPLAGGTMTGNIAHASNLTLDIGGNLTLDADGSHTVFADGGTEFGRVSNESSNLVLYSLVADKDIKFNGVPTGGSSFTALTLDMSDAGTATFNNKVGIGASPASGLHLTGTDNTAAKITLTNSANSNTYSIHPQNNAQTLKFQEDGATVMILGTGGKLGIGDTADPTRRLTVKSAGTNATQISLVDNDSTNEVFAVGQQSDGDGFLTVKQDDGTTKVLFDASGDSYIAGGSLHIGSTDSIASSSEIFSVYSASTGHTKLVNNSDSYATVYLHNESTTANTFQPSIIIQKGGGNRGNIGVRNSDSVLGIHGQGGISLRTSSTSLQASTERLNIGSDGFVKFGAGNGFGSLHNTGQNVTSSFANYFDFSDLAVGGGQERGMYLVALSRNGGSVGSRLLAYIGVSTNQTVYVYEILASAVLSIQGSGSNLQVKHSSTGTQTIQGTAIPVAIDHT